MYKQNSKEVARVDNTPAGEVFIDWLRLALNTARYKVKVRGRKPDKVKMKEDGLPKFYYKRDGDIPRIHATELAIYLNGVYHECDTCAVIKENMGLRDRLADIQHKLEKRIPVIGRIKKENLELRVELGETNRRALVRDKYAEYLRKKFCSLREERNNRDATIDKLKRENNILFRTRLARGRMIDALRNKLNIEDFLRAQKTDLVLHLCDAVHKKDEYIAMLFYFGEHK